MQINQALNRALALHRGGRLDEAERHYQEILRKRPKDLAVLHLLAGLYVQSGRAAEALGVLERVLSRQPAMGPAWHTLGMARRQTGDLEGALAAHLEGIRRGAADASAHNNAGVVLQDLGHLADAERHYRQAVALQPGYAGALANLGAVLKERGRWAEAEQCFRRALALAPNNPLALVNLGLLRMEFGDFADAEGAFRRALTLAPGDAHAIAGLAGALERKGDRQAAAELLLPVVRAGRATPALAGVFAEVADKLGLEDEAAALLEDMLATPGLPDAARVRLGFAAGKLYDGQDRHDAAFAHYARANRLAARNQPYDPAADAAYLEALAAVFSARALASLPRADNRSELPVFIVGMPRSGTSLVEQILASHPRVHGAGELPHMHETAVHLGTLGGGPYPACVPDTPQPALSALADAHLRRLAAMAPGKARVTDKMPHNFEHLGLIALMFPGARVIHTVRDPLDTCLSCHFQFFVGGIRYSYDLAHLGWRHRHYERLMAHWRQALPIPMLEVRYEELVADQERVSRELVAFVGLEWDDACLRFHQTRRHVNTASYDQVRQPIYTRSVERWRRYEKHLGPLREALGIP